jgi:AbrB family looped-hinge helix DNA binding protein
MNYYRSKIQDGGRVVIPVELRRALKLGSGDVVTMSATKDGEVRMITTRQAIKRAQEFIKKRISRKRSLVDELIAERRKEAAKEFADD